MICTVSPDMNLEDSYRVYIAQIGEYEPLGKEETYELIEQARADDQDALAELCQKNLYLVISIAKHFQGNGLSLMDLIQEGSLGLLKAIEKFDIDSGNEFSTYASQWIRQKITRALADTGRLIRVAADVADSVSAYKKAEAEWFHTHEYAPTDADMAKILNKSEQRIKDIRECITAPTSLDVPLGDDDEGDTVGGLIPDPYTDDPDARMMAEYRMNRILLLLDTLPEKEKLALIHKFGLAGEVPKS